MDRQHDIDLIENELKKPELTDRMRYKLKESRSKIIDEMQNPRIREMRKSLNKAYQEGNKGEIDDIRDFVSTHSKYS